MSGDAQLPVFIGLDLAWSARNPSGLAVLHGKQLLAAQGDLSSDDAIVDAIGPWLTPGAPALVAVDAPLRVPNETGTRSCDLALSRAWRRFEAGALPANRRLLARHGSVRGEVLVQRLAAHFGFAEEAPVPLRSPRRLVCEVYPHPAHVSLFNLPVTLKYKARGRSYDLRWAEFERYCACLESLETADPPLCGIRAWLAEKTVRTLRGQALKRFEDTLDAITCAYIAAYLWHHGPAYACVYGSVPAGHIIVPMTPDMARRLQT